MWVYESDCKPYGECLWAGLVTIYVKQPIQLMKGRNGIELDIAVWYMRLGAPTSLTMNIDIDGIYMVQQASNSRASQQWKVGRSNNACRCNESSLMGRCQT